ncbi:helix-turn-helix domain-containing protein [Kitasatospora sp. NPDC052896]|uniref:helix-turn-helix domain-containing protein n=1 Tax=Kitasatospora sp. NPDC052896 TaxID=3364061 RepID=UPI0037C6A353
MPVSPSSSAQAARQALASRLREICKDAGLTGRELAVQAGWHPSKTSRIINGKTPPSDEDIRVWCRLCGAEDQAADLIAASRTADSMYVEWRRLQRTGLTQLQESRVPLYERTRLFRVYCSNVVPGLLQTDAYAAALLSRIASFHGTPDDVAEAVEARMARSHVLRDGNHRFAVLIEESILRYRVGDSEAMAGQLGYLLAVMSLPSVSLGVIPFSEGRRMWTLEAFNVFDDKRVHVELLTAAVTVTTPTEVAQYVKAFADLAALAVYGAPARALITSAIDALG